LSGVRDDVHTGRATVPIMLKWVSFELISIIGVVGFRKETSLFNVGASNSNDVLI
jgi:hypothetical protein